MTARRENRPPAPYVGLRPFEFHEAALFYGRGENIAEMVRTLRKGHFLAVIGSSGSGKSSLVRAGLLPAIAAGCMNSGEDDLDWRFVIMRPGLDPYENLLAALLPKLSSDHALVPEIIEFRRQTLRGGPRGLVEAVADALLSESARLVVLVDQFEEIFRFLERGGPSRPGDGVSVAERRNTALAFVDMLLATAAERAPQVYVVLTMRSEYLGDCEAFLGLSSAIAKSQFLTPRMTREQIQDVIERPIAAFGGRIEPQVVTALLNSLGTAQDQLPRVEHALLRMWDRGCKIREQQPVANQPLTFTLNDYGVVGGFETALDQHAEQLYAELGPRAEAGQPSEKQRVAERLFRSLAVHTSQGTLVRRLSSVGEVASIAGTSEQIVAEVVEHFRQPGCNFLVATPSEPLTGKTMLDISHESLLRQWKRMGDWAEEEAQSARRYRRLSETAVLEAAGNAGLWCDPELQLALDWQKEQSPTAAWANLYGGGFDASVAFLEKSRNERDTVRATAILDRRWRTRWRLAIFIICAGVAFAIYCSGAPALLRARPSPSARAKAANLNEEINNPKRARPLEAIGDKVHSLEEQEKLKEKARKAFFDLLATFVVFAPSLTLFFALDYTGKKTFRRFVFPKILKEVAASTDKAVREERLARELAKKAITDAAVALHTTYARFWRRVGAYLLDLGLFLAVAVIMWTGLFNLPLGARLNQAGYVWLILLLPFVLDLLYDTFNLKSPKQATLGMRAMGIFVTNQYAEPLSLGGAAAWRFATLLSYVTLGLGFLIQTWTKRRQALHDLVTRTVVLSRPNQKKVPWWLIVLCCVIAIPFLMAVSIVFCFILLVSFM